MVTHNLVIVGAGGLGSEVRALVNLINSAQLQYKLLGWIDDGKEKGTFIKNLPVLGGIKDLNEIKYPIDAILAIGDPGTRAKLVQQIVNPLVSFPNMSHPGVRFWSTSEIKVGQGNIFMQDVILTTDISIGNFNLIHHQTILSHDTTIGDFCSLMPGVKIIGGGSIGNQVLINSGSVIKKCTTILTGAVV
jgi:sugar O-acyltransferase (sialic acid O-acetyltransferase NeuD family)